MGLKHDSGPSGEAARKVFQVTIASIPGLHLSQRSKIKGTRHATQHANRQFSRFQSIYTHITLPGIGIQIIPFKYGGTVRTFFVTIAASSTFFAVYQYSTIFWLFTDSFYWASTHAGWFLTMVAGDPLIMDTYKREAAFFVFIYLQVLE